MKIFDPSFPQRLARLLQSRGQFQAPLEVPFAGLVITIPGELVLERAGGGENMGRANATIYQLFSSPSAGAEILNVGPSVTSREAWHPVIMRARLVTSATVQTRYVDLRITNEPSGTPSSDYFRDGIVSGQAASLTWDYTWALGQGDTVNNTGNGRSLRSLPDMMLLPGHRLTTLTSGIQAGDQFSLVQLLYESVAYA